MTEDTDRILEKLDEQKAELDKKLDEQKKSFDIEFKDVKEAQRNMHTDVRELRKEAREDNKELWQTMNEMQKCQSRMEVEAMKDRGRIHVLERENKTLVQNQTGIIKNLKKNEDKFDEHLDDGDKHFNKAKAEETNLNYLARKRVLAIFLSALAMLVSGVTAWILNGLPNPFP